MQIADDPALEAPFFTPDRPHAPRRLPGPALRSELAVAAAVVAGSLALTLLALHGGTGGPAVWLALTVLYAVGSCVAFHVGTGSWVPTQIALLPMLTLLPPGAVPPAVIAALLVATAVTIATKGWPMDRLISAFGDAAAAVGAAAVIAAFGAPAARWATVPIYLLAFGGQTVVDIVASSVRLRPVRDIAWRKHVRAYASIFVADSLLTPVALGVAIVAARDPWAALLAAPLLGLLALLVHDREARIAVAERRLEALTRQRRRHQRACSRSAT